VTVMDMTKQNRYQRLVAFADTLVSQKPDLLFTVDAIGLLPHLMGVLKDPPDVLAWFYDNPLPFLKEFFLSINKNLHLFLWDQAYIEPLKERGFKHLHYQHYATNPSVYHRLELRQYTYDVSFVGTFSEKRKTALLALADHGIMIHVFGSNAWADVKHDHLRYEGMATNRKDCPLIYQLSRINLNLTSEQLITAVPVRIFDVTACGGFILSDFREDLERLFVEGKELVICQDIEEMAKSIKYYLGHEQEREQISAAGYLKTTQQYCFDDIIPGMLDIVVQSASQDTKNEKMQSADYARAAWIAGMSCIKFNDLDQAAELLFGVLKYCPDEEIVIASLCLLAARLGEEAHLKELLNELRDKKSEWIKEESSFFSILHGGKISLWNLFYERFFGIQYHAGCHELDGVKKNDA